GDNAFFVVRFEQVCEVAGRTDLAVDESDESARFRIEVPMEELRERPLVAEGIVERLRNDAVLRAEIARQRFPEILLHLGELILDDLGVERRTRRLQGDYADLEGFERLRGAFRLLGRLEVPDEQRLPQLQVEGDDGALFPAIAGNFGNVRHGNPLSGPKPGLGRRPNEGIISLGNDALTTFSNPHPPVATT